MFATLGAVESAVFKGVGPGGFDIYEVKFAHGSVQFRIGLDADGKVQGVNIRPDGDGTPGGVVACAQEATLRPAAGASPITLTFINRSGSDMRLFALDFQGKRVPYGTVGNERSSAPIWTAVTQPIIVADSA